MGKELSNALGEVVVILQKLGGVADTAAVAGKLGKDERIATRRLRRLRKQNLVERYSLKDEKVPAEVSKYFGANKDVSRTWGLTDAGKKFVPAEPKPAKEKVGNKPTPPKPVLKGGGEGIFPK